MLQGSLENFALDEVLGLLAGTSKTGRLDISGARGTGSLAFHDGRLTEAMASYTANGTELEDVMFELLRYGEGTFSFTSGEVQVGELMENVASVLANAEARLRDWQAIEEIVPSLDHQVAPKLELPTDEVTVARTEWSTLMTIGSGCAVSHVCDRLSLGEVEGSRRIKNLAERELVTVGEPLGAYRRSAATAAQAPATAAQAPATVAQAPATVAQAPATVAQAPATAVQAAATAAQAAAKTSASIPAAAPPSGSPSAPTSNGTNAAAGSAAAPSGPPTPAGPPIPTGPPTPAGPPASTGQPVPAATAPGKSPSDTGPRSPEGRPSRSDDRRSDDAQPVPASLSGRPPKPPVPSSAELPKVPARQAPAGPTSPAAEIPVAAAPPMPSAETASGAGADRTADATAVVTPGLGQLPSIDYVAGAEAPAEAAPTDPPSPSEIADFGGSVQDAGELVGQQSNARGGILGRYLKNED